jgi:Xaa-Pro aminopeptidase
MNYIPHSELISRRQKLFEQMADDSICIFFSAQIQYRNADVENRFRQNSDFWYFTGVDQQDCVVVFKKSDGKITSQIFVPRTDHEKTAYVGQALNVIEIERLSGISKIEYFDNFEKHLKSSFAGVSKVYFDPQESSFLALRQQIMSYIFRNERRSTIENILELCKTSKITQNLRLFKSDWEIEQMGIAAKLNIKAHQFMEANLYKRTKRNLPMFEYHLEADLLHSWKSNNLNWSYWPIVASGSNAVTLHYNANNDLIDPDKLILVDAGCEYNYYASDITRCYSLRQNYSETEQAIYNLVLKAQKEALKELSKQDSTTISFHNKTCEVLTKGLIELGILHGSLEENLTQEKYKRFFMHGTGHFLGLDVHDIGKYRELDGSRANIAIEERMSLTVEPGLYFGKRDLSVPKAFRGIGIRIEDNVVIAKDKQVEVLTEKLAK